MCMEQNITITTEMADKMTPEKAEAGNEREKAMRTDLLLKLAKCCKKQGNYKLATKKFTQAGDKMKAMKCLLKTGDTDKIVYFANISRKREIYIIAANYMQGLDWHNDPQIMSNIISFYSKARALDSLSTFYEACAQVEIDEYRDYNKALAALKEAFKVQAKARGEEKGSESTSSDNKLQMRIELIERFVAAKGMQKTEPQEMVKICQQLLDDPYLTEAIREGDICALLVEYFAGSSDSHKAYKICKRMVDRGIDLVGTCIAL
jgi:intraflagellar transport protein 140